MAIPGSDVTTGVAMPVTTIIGSGWGFSEGVLLSMADDNIDVDVAVRVA